MTDKVDVQAGSQLAQLPAEVLTRITRWVDTPTLSAVRISCKLVERKLFSSWAREFFRKRQFMISSFSLNTLVEISEHPHLGPVLQHLIVATDKQEAARMPPSAAIDDQDFLLDTGAWIPLLTAALGNLSNLATVDLRDFDSHTRFRDGPAAAWRSYGAPTIQKELQRRPSQWCDTREVARLFRGIMVAMADSGAAPSNIEILTRGAALPDSAFHFPAPVLDKLKPALERVKKLHLALSEQDNREHYPSLYDFLTLTPNVTWLRLNIHGQNPDPFLKCLSEPVSATASTNGGDAPIALKNLSSLDIGFVCFERPELLRDLLDKFPVRSLSLWKCGILDSRPATAAIGKDVPNLWAETIRSLAQTKVRRLTAGELYQRREFTVAPVRFSKAPGIGNLLKLPSPIYPGDMFNAAADDTALEWPKAVDYGDEGSEDDDDEDDRSADEDEDEDEDADQENEDDEDDMDGE